MRVSPFFTGIATGALAGMAASAMAAGLMQSPKVRHSVQRTAHCAEQAAHNLSAHM